MNSKMILFILLLMTTLLTACGGLDTGGSDDLKSEENNYNGERFKEEIESSGIMIVTDKETGCKYLFVKKGYGGGLSPLYNENGELYCEQVKIDLK